MSICDKCNTENTIQAVHCVKCGVLLSHFEGGDKPRKHRLSTTPLLGATLVMILVKF